MTGRRGPAVVVRDGAGGRSIGVEPITARDPGPGEVLVRRSVSGVSTGTDRWVMSGRFGWAELPPPFVPGYQAAGLVEAVGPGVTGLELGQPVFVTRSEPWAEVAASWGGHATLAVSPADEVYDADGVPPARAALTVTAQVGWNAASRLTLPDGAPVVVFGDGIIGASGALAAAERGFDVTVVGRHRERLDAVASLGFATLLAPADGTGPDAAADLRQSLTALAPHAVIDTVQNPAAFDAYATAFAAGVIGQIVYSGHSPDGATTWADAARLQQLGLTAHFVSGWTPDRVRTVLSRMRAGGMPVDRLVGVTATTPEDAAALMTDVADGRHRALAAVIDWAAMADHTTAGADQAGEQP